MTQPDKPRAICTDDYKRTFYGIVNAQGDIWTPLVFDSQASADKHLSDAAKGISLSILRTHRVVPVRAVITVLQEEPAS